MALLFAPFTILNFIKVMGWAITPKLNLRNLSYNFALINKSTIVSTSAIDAPLLTNLSII